jgi:hypothetical protein
MPREVQFGRLTKDEFEANRDWDDPNYVALTDEQWDNIADEVEGRVDNYIDGLLANLITEVAEGDWD